MLLLPQIYSQNFLGQYNFLCILLHFLSIVCTISNDWQLLSFHSRQLLPHIENTFCSTNIPCILFPLSSPHSKFFSHFLNQIHFLDHLYIIHSTPHLLFHMEKFSVHCNKETLYTWQTLSSRTDFPLICLQSDKSIFNNLLQRCYFATI